MKLEVEVKVNLKTEEVKDAVREATKKAMLDTVAKISEDAIKGSPFITGNNRRSIKYEVGPGGEVAKKTFDGAVYSTSGYGGYLETGTGKMAAQPYMKPALDRNYSKEKFTAKVKGHLK